MTRTIRRTASAVALAALALVLVTAPAHAAAYRYWTYWQAAPTAAAWSFATQGAGTFVPADGAVEGWAFGVTTASADPQDAPAGAPDFATICAGTPAQDGRKRVALIVDPGSPALAPDGETPPAGITACVVADADASGYEILRSMTDVRTENGLICGVGGYPARECAPVLDDADATALLSAASAAAVPSTTATGTDTSADTSAADAPSAEASDAGTPLATIAVAVLLLGGAAVGVAAGRRRRASRDPG